MSVDLSQFIPSFLEESFEGLALMESSLLELEQGDSETINSIFRAAHSIKGGAGTFGFEQITEFTHLVETLLDEVRDGRRTIEKDDVELLLNSVDCTRMMLEAVRDDTSYDTAKVEEVSKLLTVALNQPTVDEETELTLSLVEPVQKATWNISFIPEHHLVQTGNDPLLLFNALRDFGELEVKADCSQLPPLTDKDPEELYLSWQLTLVSDSATEEDIREVFEWVEDECQLDITQEETEQTGVIAPTEVSETDIGSEKQDNIENTSEDSMESESTDSESLTAANNASGTAQAASSVPTNNGGNAEGDNAKPTEKVTTTPKAKADSGSIRVGVDKVDNLINLVGELVITQSMLSELGNDFDISKVERLTNGLEQLLQNTKELQESVMRIRMLPISFSFNRFPRLIHDLSRKTGKDIELIIKGEQTELDKTVMEQIGDPLVHLVRNAVDHGIEPADIRIANGKPEKGTITLDAYHQGGSIVIEISDDGGGINRDAVMAKAIEKGVVEANAVLTDQQVYELIFEPGFSTAKEISDISGRGVGMDVVRKNIQALGGRIQIESELGKGSKFKVNLPLTLAIVDGQLVRVGSETYIIPLITIVESLQAKAELINRVSGNMVLYRLREDNVPVLPIYQLFNLPADSKDIENALLVVVEADGQKVGLMVDDLLAQQQVVIKSLRDNYQQVEGISGATILGDGSVAMILDVPGLISLAMQNNSGNSAREMESIVEREPC